MSSLASIEDVEAVLRKVMREERSPLLGNAKMARYLGKSVRWWRELYRADAALRAMAVDVGKGREQLRWPVGRVVEHLRGRR